MKKLLFCLLAIVTIGILIFSGCGEEATPTPAPAPTPTPPPSPTAQPQPAPPSGEQPVYGGTLRVLTPLAPAGPVGWVLGGESASLPFRNYVWVEPIIRYLANGTVEPLLAESWEFPADYMSVTFHLRKGVQFHDGSEFNADAVKFTLDRNIELKNAQSRAFESVDIIDNYTVRINFKYWENSLWTNLIRQSMMFVSPTAFRAHNEDIQWMREHPIGTGPFKFVAYKADQYVKFEKFEDYWQEGKPYLDALEFLTVKDQNTIELALQAGEGDILQNQGGKALAAMDKVGFTPHAYYAGTYWIAPDSKNPASPFADIRVRQAVEYAIDKQAICNTIGYGFYVPNSQVANTPSSQYNPDIPANARPYDPTKAKALLAEAGYPEGFETTLHSQPMFKNEDTLYLQFLNASGIKAKLVQYDNIKYFQVMQKGWDGLLDTAQSYTPNFAASVRNYLPPIGINYPSTIVPESATKVIDEAVKATDGAVLIAKAKEFNKILFDDCTFICTFSSAMGYSVAPYVKNGGWFEGCDYEAWRPDNVWLAEH